MVFKCDKCGYETDRRSNFNKHQKNKTPCDLKEFNCEGCNLKYKYKKSLENHYKKCSKYIELKNPIKEDPSIKEEFLTKDESTNTNSANSDIPEILPFGMENIDHITPEVIVNTAKKNSNGIALFNLICLKHFDIKHPENMNFHLSTKMDKKYVCYKSCKNQELWNFLDTSDFVINLFLNSYSMIQNHFNLLSKKTQDTIDESYIDISDDKSQKFKAYLKKMICKMKKFHEFILERKKVEIDKIKSTKMESNESEISNMSN